MLGTVISAILGSNSAGRAADAQQAGIEEAIREQQRQYDTSLRLLEPQRYLGYQAMDDIARLYGYGTAGYMPADQLLALSGGKNQQQAAGYGPFTNALARGFNRLNERFGVGNRGAAQAGAAYPNALAPRAAGQPGDMSRFFTSPDYNFRRKEGERGIAASFAAKGGGGNALKALAEYNSNLASGEYNNYLNRLFNIAGAGQTATTEAIDAGTNAANAISGGRAAIGDARASGIIGRANATIGGLNALQNQALWFMGGW